MNQGFDAVCLLFQIHVCWLEKVQTNNEPTSGFNAATGTYENVVQAGVIDPTKLGERTIRDR